MSKQEVECHECEYTWNTSSEMRKVTCPNCNTKTPRKEAPEAQKA